MSNRRRNERKVWDKLFAWMRKRNLGHLNLENAQLRFADLEGAKLHNANFRNADLEWANLKNADLDSAQFYKAELVGANLENAAMRNADLGDSNCASANFKGAYLHETNFYGAYLASAIAIVSVSGVGSEGRYAWFWVYEGKLRIMAGCFNGTKEALLLRSKNKAGTDSQHYKGYAAAIAYAEIILAEFLDPVAEADEEAMRQNRLAKGFLPDGEVVEEDAS